MSDTAYNRSVDQSSQRDNSKSHSGSAYGHFLAMVGTSTAIMFGLMYLNTYSIEHLYWSETRFYMTFVMGAVMAVVMLLFMSRMYKNVAANVTMLAGSVALFAGALWLVRSQATIQDESWMSAMIPHHSIAIMTSKRAEITDPRVKTLAEEIVVAQDREIAEMRYLLADIAANGEAGPDWPLGKSEGPAQLEGLQQAISSPVIAGIRPAPMTEEEMTRALGSEATCTFVRAINAEPVIATDGSGNGVAKISDSLVTFQANGGISTGGVLTADGGRMTVAPGTSEGGEDATLLFELTGDQPLKVGFMGYWSCNA